MIIYLVSGLRPGSFTLLAVEFREFVMDEWDKRLDPSESSD